MYFLFDPKDKHYTCNNVVHDFESPKCMLKLMGKKISTILRSKTVFLSEPLLLTMISEGFGCEHFSKLYNVRMIHFFPHINKGHTFGIYKTETCGNKTNKMVITILCKI